MTTKKAFGIASLALALALSTSAATGQEPAALETNPDQIEVGMGVICDTENEVTRFVQMIGEQDASVAIEAVNREVSKPVACGLATVAFKTGKQLGDVRNGNGTYTIMEISIVAATANDGSWREISPRTQFTAVRVKGIDI